MPIQLVGETFIYLEEDGPSGVDYQMSQSPARVGQDDITHINETVLPAAAPSTDGGASQAASIPLSMDLDSKRMVDDLVDSEATDEDENIDQPALISTPQQRPAKHRSSSSQFREAGNDTSYGLIGSGTAREHFGDQPLVSPRPLLPSIDK